MKNNVKSKSTRKPNLNPAPVTGAVLRRRAYAWHLDANGRRTACSVIFRELGGDLTRPVIAPLRDWLAGQTWIGLRLLLGYIAHRAHGSGSDEAAVFNRISECTIGSVLKINNGDHLNNVLRRLAKQRMLDTVALSKRLILFEDLDTETDERAAEYYSLTTALDAYEAALQQVMVDRIVAAAYRGNSIIIGDRVFNRYLETEASITQEELAAEFEITQTKVCRILNDQRATMRELVEHELGRPLELKARKPRTPKSVNTPVPAPNCEVGIE